MMTFMIYMWQHVSENIDNEKLIFEAKNYHEVYLWTSMLIGRRSHQIHEIMFEADIPICRVRPLTSAFPRPD